SSSVIIDSLLCTMSSSVVRMNFAWTSLLVPHVLQEPLGRNFTSQSLFPRFVIYGRCKALELSPDRADVQKKARLRVAAAIAMAAGDNIDKRGHVNNCGWQVDLWYRCPFPLVAGHVTQESGTSVEHLLRRLRQARRRLARAHGHIHHLRK